jgi:branched-chain amino acid transport system ATP-binding protein
MGTCEHIHVLDYGQVIASGSPEQVKNDPIVVNAYLGAP